MAPIGKWIERSVVALVLIALISGCGQESRSDMELRDAPVFMADSAYGYVERQVAFGPRVPRTEAHRACGDWLVQKLKTFGAEVSEQTDSVLGLGGQLLPLRNIIGSFHPERKERLLLAAHWDTRPYADQDTAKKDRPILGANDGASGVAVLLEVARGLSSMEPNVGVDIIFFDLEDQGRPEYEEAISSRDEHFYCLGSRYWATGLDRDADYRYAIVLDMVGGKEAQFTLEKESMDHAETQMRRIWHTADMLGFGTYFRPNLTPMFINDHTYLNKEAGIPSLCIIQRDGNTQTTYWKHWHTHADNLDAIDRKTLKAAGQTVMQVVYNE